MSEARRLRLIANARLPSERAQSLQVMQSASAFARAGVETELLYAQRAHTPSLPEGQTLFDYYQIAAGLRPTLRATPCTDWIDRVPRSLQFAPARWQELSFSRNAAKAIERESDDVFVLSRELECAHRLISRGRRRVFVELHRIPGGKLRRLWLADIARAGAGWIAISGGVRDDLVGLGVAADSILVAHDAFDPARFASLPTRAAARAELGIRPDAKVVVYTGGLLEWKGVDLLVEASRERPELEFLIAGGMAADVERLRRLASSCPNVRVDGFQSPARVAMYLAAADIGVAPNRSEPAISAKYTSPLKVFEAMAVGLPLVASDLPSIRELLNHGRDAWLVHPDDSRALSHGLARLAGDDALRAAISREFAARAPQHTWDARAHSVLEWMASRDLRA